MNLVIALFTLVLILVSVFLVLLVLMQKSKSDGGMGSALGGGAAEATFGAETGNVLTDWTIKASIGFFVLSLLLYLGHIHMRKAAAADAAASALPTIDAPATLPAAPATDGVAAPVESTPAPDATNATTTPAPATTEPKS